MTEKLLTNKKNGMAILLLTILGLIVSVVVMIVGAIGLESNLIFGLPLLIVGILWLSIGWIPFIGLKILKPQEALVLTLFGKYVGTLKGDGFYSKYEGLTDPFQNPVDDENTKL